jgi:hypothetical protein
MKISAKGSSKYLTKEDVPTPIIAMIAGVKIETLQNPREDKPILYFAGGALKGLVLNVTNRRVMIRAYGDETDAWAGKPVEIYINPDVTNSSGEIVGGVRLRIPAPATVVSPAAAVGKPIQAPPAKPELTAEEKFNLGMQGLDNARTAERLDAWAIALGRLPLNEQQQAAAQRCYERNLTRFAAPASSARPAVARS